MGKKKKLAIISTHPVQYNAPLFKLLAERGNIDLKVFYTWGDTVLENKYDPGFGRVIQWDIPLLEGYAYAFPENSAADKGAHHFKGIDNPGLIKTLQECAPDAILVYGWAFKSHLRLMRYFHKKIPVFFRGDSTLLDGKPGGYKAMARKIFLRWVYRHVDYAFFAGKNNYDYFKQAGLQEKQLVYAPHAVDNARFYRNDRSAAQAALLRQELHIPADAVVYLFAGKLEAKKDPLLLSDAFAAAGLDTEAHLVFTGNGHLEKELKAAVAGRSNVHLMEFRNQSEMPAVYQMADIYVLPSRGPGETWGLAINESMAAGCAIIASDKCGGAVDLVENGKNGFVFRSGNRDDLAARLRQVFDNRGQLAAMKQASLAIVDKFSFTAVAAAIESTLYGKL